MICIQFTKNRHIICFLFASRRHKSFEKSDQSFGKWICNIINYPLTFSCSGCTFLSKQRSILIYVCHLLKPIYWALTRLWPFFLTAVFVQFMIKYKVGIKILIFTSSTKKHLLQIKMCISHTDQKRFQKHPLLCICRNFIWHRIKHFDYSQKIPF